MDWTAATETAGQAQGYDSVKQQLPITYVLYTLGTDYEIAEDGRAHALCPFHTEANPSFDVFGEYMERWGCYPCGFAGDVFDLLQKLEGLNFPGSLARGKELAAALAVSDWKPTGGVVKRTLDLSGAQAMVGGSARDLSGLSNFLEARGVPFTADQLHTSFGVGSVGPSVVVPYFTSDGSLATYKHRTVGTKAMAAPGSVFGGILYGEWRDEDHTRPILLCEGESDVWSAAYYLSSSYSVLGLPVGAGTPPDSYVERLAGRLVVLAFDGDTAGRDAARRWAAKLTKSTVRIVPLPEGSDLASMGEALVERVQASRAIPAQPTTPLRAEGDGYFRIGKDDTLAPISNWIFRASRELVDSDGNMAYEGMVLPSGQTATLTSGDLSTATRTLAWATKHGGTWYGTDRDTRTFLGQLQAEGPFLEPAHMASVAGLQGDQFVYPAGHIGAAAWKYVPQGSDAKLADKIFIKKGSINVPQTVHLIRSLHKPSVMDPILAWLAAAPLRSIRSEFPVLAITGSSGSGKTTLTDLVLRIFSGTHIGTNLTGTTRYGIEALVSSTNAFPVWVDEYRPGARADTAMAFQQILRDAYTGQGSVRGGGQDNWAQVSSSPVIAPIVVTGENAFEETSHLERMISINLTREGRNAQVLQQIRDLDASAPGAFAYAYLSWLYHNFDELPGPVDFQTPAGLELSPRQVINLGRLEWGWELLDRFVQAHGGDPLESPILGDVVATAVEDGQSSPIESALVYARGHLDGGEFIFRGEGQILYVQATDFIRFCFKANVPLPGNEKAVSRFLVERFNGEVVSGEFHGLTKRVVRIDGAMINYNV